MDTAPRLQYEKARELICNGDLLSFTPHDANFIHALTLRVTNSKYYHTGLAVWLQSPCGQPRLFVCEAVRGGRRLVPLSIYSNTAFDVTCCPVDFDKMEGHMLERVGRVPYGFCDFIAVGLRRLFGIHLRNQRGEICSELAQKMYEKAGLHLFDEVLSPGEIYALLKEKGVPDRVHVHP